MFWRWSFSSFELPESDPSNDEEIDGFESGTAPWMSLAWHWKVRISMPAQKPISRSGPMSPHPSSAKNCHYTSETEIDSNIEPLSGPIGFLFRAAPE